MDVDEEDEESGSTQRLKRVPDYGIEVDFEVLSREEREVSGTHPPRPHVAFSFFPTYKADDNALPRLDDVETKLVDTEKEADKARRDSKNARDTFNDVKQRRYGTPSVAITAR